MTTAGEIGMGESKRFFQWRAVRNTIILAWREIRSSFPNNRPMAENYFSHYRTQAVEIWWIGQSVSNGFRAVLGEKGYIRLVLDDNPANKSTLWERCENVWLTLPVPSRRGGGGRQGNYPGARAKKGPVKNIYYILYIIIIIKNLPQGASKTLVSYWFLGYFLVLA